MGDEIPPIEPVEVIVYERNPCCTPGGFVERIGEPCKEIECAAWCASHPLIIGCVAVCTGIPGNCYYELLSSHCRIATTCVCTWSYIGHSCEL